MRVEKECFWYDDLIQRNEKFVTLKFIGKKTPFKIYFHIIHYAIFSVWLEDKTKFEKDYKFEIFSKLSVKERSEEELIAIELGLEAEFKKDRYNLDNALLYNIIDKTINEEEICPITKEMKPLCACVECTVQECPKEEFCIPIHLRE